MVNGRPDGDPPFSQRAMTALRRVTQQYETSGRASVSVEPEEPDSIEVGIRPTATGPAPLTVEVYEFGELNVLVGEAGFLLELSFDAPDENLEQATSIVESVMARGCRMWLAPRPAGEDPRGILELELGDRTVRSFNDTTPLALLIGKRRWPLRSYSGY
jgi:hypothetical protein